MSLFADNELSICINFDSLSGYLSLSPTIALALQFDVPVRLYPVLENIDPAGRQTEPASDDPLREYKRRRMRARRLSADRELRRMCERMAISTEQGTRRVDPFTASVGLLWLSERVTAGDCFQYCQQVYEGVFRTGVDVSDASLLARWLPDPSGFEAYLAGTGQSEVASLQNDLLDAGVIDSPAYFFQDELMIGRQHLPRLRWLLNGREGASPY